MRFKSVYQLQKERSELGAWFNQAWASVDNVSALTKAILAGDGAVLAKASNETFATAKADADDLRKSFPKLPVDSLQSLTMGHRMATVLKLYNERLAAIAADERRSRRVNDIMTNALLPHGGPWAVN